MASRDTTIASVQVLRAIAAIAVVFHHIGIALNDAIGTTISWSMVGASGVDLFFVISGFIMTVISWDQFGRPRAAFDFMSRRLVRILPMYWLVTALYALVGSYGRTAIRLCSNSYSEWRRRSFMFAGFALAAVWAYQSRWPAFS